jgi:RNA polymerase sigma-70 factor (ECF subfamily)
MTEPLTSSSESEPGTTPAVVAFPVPAAKETLVELFEREESAVLGFAIGLVGRRAVAEELVQEAFLRLHQLWGQVENPRAWLYRSLRNLALNHLRDHRRETVVDEPDGPGNEQPPDEVLGRLEAVGMVRLLIAELAPEDQNLIQLKYHDDLKYQEISRKTGLSVSNVGYKLHHLLKGLADALRHAGIDGSLG